MGLKAVSGSSEGGGNGAGNGTGTPTLNYDMPKFRKAMWKHIQRSGLVKMLGFGESHITGEGSGTSTFLMTGAWPYGICQGVANILGNQYGYINRDCFMGDQQTTFNSVSYPAYDSRITFGSGWAGNSANNFTLGSRFFAGAAGAAGDLTFQPALTYDKVVVIYPTATSLSTSITVANGTGTLGTINQSPATGLVTVTYTCAAGSSPITFTNGDGSHAANIEGCYTYLSTSPGMLVIQGGYMGGNIAAVGTSTLAYSSMNVVASLAPDITIVEEWVNDALNSLNITTYSNALATILTTLKISGDVIMVGGFPCNDATVTANQAAYTAAQASVCAAAGVNFIDMSRWFGATWAIANTAGLMADNFHPNKTGYGVYAQIIASALMSVL